MLNKYMAWRKTRQGAILATVLYLIAAYIFGSLALDTANWLYYFATFFLIWASVLSVITIFRAQPEKSHAKKRKSPKST